MLIRMSQLSKFRQKSWQEFYIRGKQELAQYGERLFRIGQGELSDQALLRETLVPMCSPSCETAAGQILQRLQSAVTAGGSGRSARPFMPFLACREEVARIMEARFPVERTKVLAKADRAIDGRFDLLGLSDLCFGNPIDWQFEPTSGKRTDLRHWSRIAYLDSEVAGDQKVTWELNRHAHFITLGQAYWLTGEERYATAFLEQIHAWMDANPPKQGINWASSLEVSFRAIAWVWALHLFAASPQITASFVTRLVKFFVQHGRHIESYLSYYFSPNTHLTGEALGLFYLGVTMPELSAAQRWRDLGLKILLEELPRQIREDGVYFEQSSYYHRYTTDFYIHMSTIAETAGITLPPSVTQKLSQLLEHLMWITKPDGSSPFYGDDDGGRLVKLGDRRANDFRDTLSIGAAMFGRGDWKYVATSAPMEMLWLLGPEGLRAFDRVQEEPPTSLARGFESSGYYVLRDGWSAKSSCIFIDCGPHGTANCGHAHSDALSFEFATGSSNWFIDPGTYSYVGMSESRNSFRSTAAHNAVTVDGCSQSVPAGPFSWDFIADARSNGLIETPQSYYVTGEHHGFHRLADPVIHARTVMFRKPVDRWQSRAPYVLIQDRFDARAQHQYALHFHCAPGCFVEREEACVNIAGRDGRYLFLLSLKVEENGACSPIAISIEEGWVSHCYGQRESAPQLVAACTATGRSEVVTLLVPFVSGESCRVRGMLAEDLKEMSERGETLPDLLRKLSGWLANALPSLGVAGRNA